MSRENRTFRFTITTLLSITALIALMIPTTHVYLIPGVDADVQYLDSPAPPVPFLSKIPYHSKASRSRGGESDDGLSRMVTPRIEIVSEEESPYLAESMPKRGERKNGD